MRTENDLRAAYAKLAADAPRIDALHLVTRPRTGANRRWVVAATVLAMAVVVAAAVAVSNRARDHGRRSQLPASGPQLTCTPPAGELASANQLAADRRTIERRLAGRGIRGATVRVLDGRDVVITAPKGGRADLDGLCTDHRLELRPLVLPAVPVDPGATKTGDPLAIPGFTPPTSELAYLRMPTARQEALKAALATSSCDSWTPSDPHAVRVVCDDAVSPSVALLLGPAVVTGRQVERARAVPPSAGSGQVQWTVEITFTAGGTDAWSSYTATNNSAGQQDNVTSITDCAPSAVPCADFVAFVVDGDVVSVPLTEAPMADRTQLAGDFSRQMATTLAAQLDAGELAVPLRTVPAPGPTATHS